MFHAVVVGAVVPGTTDDESIAETITVVMAVVAFLMTWRCLRTRSYFPRGRIR